MKKSPSINRVLFISILLLIFFEISCFLYVILTNFSKKPELTGTASDIIIALTNSALVWIAIAAYRKIFKERIHERAVDKIDDLLINLDLAISEINGIVVNFIVLDLYYSYDVFKDDLFIENLSEYKDKTSDLGEFIRLVNSNDSILNRWRIDYKFKNKMDIKYCIENILEIYILQTSIYIALQDCIAYADGRRKIKPDFDFLNLRSQFDEKRKSLLESYDKIKSTPADEIFNLY